MWISDLVAWLDAHQAALTAVSSLLTSAAIIVGGGWALKQYWKRRDPHPKARLRHAVTHRAVDATRIWIRVELTIENCGAGLLHLESGLTRISHVLPLRGPLPNRMSPPFGRELAWPQLHGDEKDWTELKIEPGESDSVSYDFIVDGDVQTVLVYSHVDNRSHGTSAFGWQTSTIYHIDQHGATPQKAGDQGTTDTEATSDAPRQLEGRYPPAGSETALKATNQGQVGERLLRS